MNTDQLPNEHTFHIPDRNALMALQLWDKIVISVKAVGVATPLKNVDCRIANIDLERKLITVIELRP